MTAVTRTAEDDALETVAAGAADDPFAVLGPHGTTHNGRPSIAIRTMQPSTLHRLTAQLALSTLMRCLQGRE